MENNLRGIEKFLYCYIRLSLRVGKLLRVLGKLLSDGSQVSSTPRLFSDRHHHQSTPRTLSHSRKKKQNPNYSTFRQTDAQHKHAIQRTMSLYIYICIFVLFKVAPTDHPHTARVLVNIERSLPTIFRPWVKY